MTLSFTALTYYKPAVQIKVNTVEVRWSKKT
jgi:hypothetical protein